MIEQFFVGVVDVNDVVFVCLVLFLSCLFLVCVGRVFSWIGSTLIKLIFMVFMTNGYLKNKNG